MEWSKGEHTRTCRFKYPRELQELLFHEWLSSHIKVKNKSKEDVLDKIHIVVNGCPIPTTSYNGLYIRCQLFKTRTADATNYGDNSVIIYQFLVDINSNFEDSSMEVVKDFIEYIEQILEIDFIHMKKTFIMCKWFGRAQLRPHTSVQTDDYWFHVVQCASRKISR